MQSPHTRCGCLCCAVCDKLSKAHGCGHLYSWLSYHIRSNDNMLMLQVCLTHHCFMVTVIQCARGSVVLMYFFFLCFPLPVKFTLYILGPVVLKLSKCWVSRALVWWVSGIIMFSASLVSLLVWCSWWTLLFGRTANLGSHKHSKLSQDTVFLLLTLITQILLC